jgi:hypothetical protein
MRLNEMLFHDRSLKIEKCNGRWTAALEIAETDETLVANGDTAQHAFDNLTMIAEAEGHLSGYDGHDEYNNDSCEDRDGDHESALASAGFGTDEDYGCYDDCGEW